MNLAKLEVTNEERRTLGRILRTINNDENHEILSSRYMKITEVLHG